MNKASMDEFFSLLNDSESIPKFEQRWGAWLERNNLNGNRWLANMYKIRFS